MSDMIHEGETGSSQVRIRRLQQSVAILLRFNSEAAGLSVPEKVIELVTPLLRKEPADIGAEEEIDLWNGCDVLSRRISPVTLEGARLTVELADWGGSWKLWKMPPSVRSVRISNFLWLSGTLILLALYIISQAYVVFIGRALDDLGANQAQVESISQQEALAGNGSAGGLLVGRLQAERENARAGMEAARDAIAIFTIRFNNASTDALTPPTEGMVDATTIRAEVGGARAVGTLGRIHLDLVQGYVIPLLLGLIGAFAYVMRQRSSAILSHGYRSANSVREKVRIAQSATFGVLAGLIAGAVGGGMSVPVFALLCGYNSDIAFKAMDHLLLRVKGWLQQGSPEAQERSGDASALGLPARPKSARPGNQSGAPAAAQASGA